MIQKHVARYRLLLTAAACSAAATIAATPAHAQTLRPLVSDIKDVRQTCHRLLDVPMMNGKVMLAQMETATPYRADLAAPGAGDTPARPQHCLVRGALNQRSGIDGKPYALQFELRLPVDWNGRFWYSGGGGMDGVLFAADGAEKVMTQEKPSALARGFAVITTDSGHQADMFAPGNEAYLFGVDPQARDEYGDQQIPLTHGAGMRLIARAYGAAPARSYFYGVSNGGRQAMKAAQRYPYLFDGIVNYASGFRLTQAALAGGIFRAQQAAKIAPKKPDGTPDIAQPLTPEKFQLITDQILNNCDALDGAKDGMVYSQQCRIDPMKWTCGTLQDKICLTPKEALYLRDVIAGPKLRSGKPIYAPLAIDPYLHYAITYPFFPFYPLLWGGTSHLLTSPPTVGNDMMSYLLKADLDTEYAKAFATTDVYKRPGVEFTNADSPNLDAFMRHGGKLISFTGAADQVFSAVDAANYQEDLLDRYGREKTDAFTQLFIIPGLGHVMPYTHSVSYVDLIAAIVDWTENGKSPDGLMATALKDAAWPGRSRPICAYPQITVYKGSGSIEDGRNFICREQPKGESSAR